MTTPPRKRISRAAPTPHIETGLPARIKRRLAQPAAESDSDNEGRVQGLVMASYSVGLTQEETLELLKLHAPTVAWLARGPKSREAMGKTLEAYVEDRRGLASQLVKEGQLRDPALTLRWDTVERDAATPLAWAVSDFVAAGESLSLVGPPKIGKSVLMLEMALAKAAGRTFLGSDNATGVVLYLDWENRPREVWKRLTKMGYTVRDLDNLAYSSFPDFRGGLETEEAAERVIKLINEYDPELVVIDTLQRAIEGDESNSITIRQFYKNLLTPLRKKEIAVVRLDHTGKDPTKGSRGSSAKSDDVDQAWSLRRRRDGLLELNRTHTRTDEGPSAFVVQRGEDLIHRVVNTPPEADDNPESGALTAQDLVEVLDELGVPSDAGRPRCIAALKASQVAYRTDVLAAAVKLRKEGES